MRMKGKGWQITAVTRAAVECLDRLTARDAVEYFLEEMGVGADTEG